MADEIKDQATSVPAPARPHKVGPGTPSSKVKSMWKENCFSPDKKGNLYPNGKWQSLKVFARELMKDGNELVKKWFDAKSGKLNTKRTQERMTKLAEIASKSKSAKKK